MEISIQIILFVISGIAIAMLIHSPRKFFMKYRKPESEILPFKKSNFISDMIDKEKDLTEEDVIVAKNQLIAVFMGEQFKKDCIVKYIESNKCWACPEGETHYRMKYHNDWNQLMPVIEKINATHNEGNPHRDLMYTMQYLLGGGFRFSENERKPLLFSHENLWNRIVDFIKWTQNKK